MRLSEPEPLGEADPDAIEHIYLSRIFYALGDYMQAHCAGHHMETLDEGMLSPGGINIMNKRLVHLQIGRLYIKHVMQPVETAADVVNGHLNAELHEFAQVFFYVNSRTEIGLFRNFKNNILGIDIKFLEER